MNISYVTTYDAGDVRQWSGTGYYIAKALEHQNANLSFSGNNNAPVTKYLELKQRIYNKLGKRYLFDRVPALVRDNARQAEKKIAGNADIIFSPSTIPLGLIETDKPKVFYTDATFAGMINFYPYFTNLCRESIRNGNALEQAAFDSCAMAIYSSDWAARTAIENYKVAPVKVKVVPFGANIDCDRTAGDIEHMLTARDKKTCHLLFLGVEWERKGGDMALETAKILNEMGLPTILHIAGVNGMTAGGLPPYVQDHGFIDKHTAKGGEQLNQLFAQSHFFILPSRADCTPIVFAEANSFGMPCISTNVGGIPTLIKDDINGKKFGPGDSAEKYAGYIEDYFSNYPAYLNLCRSSFNEYETRLNWGTTGKALMNLLSNL